MTWSKERGAEPRQEHIADFFEIKFARLEYMDADRFNLSYMRHAEKWFELCRSMSLDECLESVEEEPYFIP
jgi:hypothetical protein